MRNHKQLLNAAFATCFMALTACGVKSEQKTKALLIPEGFEIMDTDTITIVTDTYVVNALKHEAEDSLSNINTEPVRPISILKSVKGAEFELIARNDSIILCQQCGGLYGDPWDGIYTEEDAFSVHHMGGSNNRWTRDLKFQYNSEKGGWFLISDRGVNFWTHDPEGTLEYDLYTEGDSLGLIPFRSFKTSL